MWVLFLRVNSARMKWNAWRQKTTRTHTHTSPQQPEPNNICALFIGRNGNENTPQVISSPCDTRRYMHTIESRCCVVAAKLWQCQITLTNSAKTTAYEVTTHEISERVRARARAHGERCEQLAGELIFVCVYAYVTHRLRLIKFCLTAVAQLRGRHWK